MSSRYADFTGLFGQNNLASGAVRAGGGKSLEELCSSLELSLIIDCKKGKKCEKATIGAKIVCIIVHPVKKQGAGCKAPGESWQQ